MSITELLCAKCEAQKGQAIECCTCCGAAIAPRQRTVKTPFECEIERTQQEKARAERERTQPKPVHAREQKHERKTEHEQKTNQKQERERETTRKTRTRQRHRKTRHTHILRDRDRRNNTAALLCFILGLLSFVAWALPLPGLLISIAAIAVGALGLRSKQKGLSFVGMTFAGFFFIVAVLDITIGAL